MRAGLVEPDRTRDRRIAYLLVRLGVGLSLFGHGLVRIPKLAAFQHELVGQFAPSIIPTGLVSVGGYVLPVAEFLVGVSVTLGILTPLGLVGGAVSMIILVFGTTTIEAWSNIGEQLLHLFALTGLLAFSGYNAYSIDHAVLRRSTEH